MVVKDGTCITLLGLTANAEFTEVHPPLGVAAGRIDKLRESRHGWRASFRRCRDASFGSDSKFVDEHKGLSTPLGAAREIQEGIAVDPLLVDSLLKNQGVEDPRL